VKLNGKPRKKSVLVKKLKSTNACERNEKGKRKLNGGSVNRRSWRRSDGRRLNERSVRSEN
jgi:hypothetical protein